MTHEQLEFTKKIVRMYQIITNLPFPAKEKVDDLFKALEAASGLTDEEEFEMLIKGVKPEKKANADESIIAFYEKNFNEGRV